MDDVSFLYIVLYCRSVIF